MSNINFLGDLALFGALVIETDQTGWPANPSIGTFIIKDQNLYGYLKVGGLETWYPFANKTVSYIHTQAVDSTTWYVNHGLGTTNLWIQVKDTNGNILAVGKQDVDDNNFTLTFTSAVSGTVMVVAPDTVEVPVVKAAEIIVGNSDGVHLTTGGVAVTGVNSTITLNGSTVLTSANIQPQIDASIAAVVGAAPAALDTLKEIADQLATDESAVSALTTTVATKAATSYVDSAVSALTTTVGTKAATTYVDSAVSTLNTAIAAKAATSYVDAALATKANTSSLATVATSGSYTDLSNKPTLFSGSYTDLTSKPTLFSGSYTDLTSKPTLFSGVFADLTGKPTTLSGYGITDAYTKSATDTALSAKANTSSLATVATSGAYADLTGKPTLATVATSGAYADLTGKPTLATVATSGDYYDLVNKPTLFSGSYADLTNKPSFAALNGSSTENFSVKNLTVSADIMPSVAGVSNIGSAALKFNAIHAKELFLDSNTLYINGTPILSSSANTMNFTADLNQGIAMTTSGTGNLTFSSNAGTTIQTTGQNGDVLIQSSGQGALTRITSVTQVTLTAPTVATVGDSTVSGNLTVNGNFNVKGTVTSIESTVATIKDNVITLNKGEMGSGVTLNVAGIDIDRGDLSRQRLIWNETVGKWQAGTTSAEVNLATEPYVTTAIAGKANTSSLATVATSGSYADLSNKPTLATVSSTGSYTDLINKPTLFSGAYADLSGKPTLSTVASSGDYADLTNKPTLFSGVFADLTSKPTTLAGYGITDAITATTAASTYAAKATTLAGYGIADAYTKTATDTALGLKANTSSLATVATSGLFADLTSKPTTLSGYGIADAYTKTATDTALAAKANSSSLATVATSGSYADLTNKPTIPTVPTAVSAFTNDSGYQTAANVATAIAAVVGAAPAALDTLKEIADQLASDESAVSALTTTVAGKAATTYVDTQLALKANTSSLATVATSGSYADLTNKPTLFSGVFADLTSKPTTLSGYGITDAITAATAASTYAAKATTLSGYGITNAYTKTEVDTALGLKTNSSSLATVATSGLFADLLTKPTTLAGYGITDAITAATAASTYAAKATTLSGYGITNAYTKTEVDTALAAKLTANAAITAGTGTKVTYDANGLVTSSTTLSASDIPSLSWTKITSGTPTTLAGYGITDAITATTAASTYAAKATTLAGYGITDAYTKTAADAATTAAIQAVVGAAPAALDTLVEIATQLQSDESAAAALTTVVSGKVTANAAITAGTGTKVTYDAKGLVTSSTTLSASDIPNHDWSKITSGKPTTLSGYGITDAQALDADLTAIAALTGTSGFLKKTAADTWALDTNTYLTGITSSQVTTALGYTPFNAANALSGGTF